MLCLNACRSTRFLEEGEYLLRKTPEITGNNTIPESELRRGILTIPNRRMLIPKTYLHLYNTGIALERDSLSWRRNVIKGLSLEKAYVNLSKWLKTKIGEPPVLIDTTQLNEDILQLRNICFANGYFFPQISYKIDTLNTWFARKKANVSFQVKENIPYLIDKVSYTFDSLLSPMEQHRLITALDTSSSLLRIGQNYNHKTFNEERIRITNALQNAGYFYFSQQKIRFLIDTLSIVPLVRDTSDYFLSRPLNVTVDISGNPNVYHIRNIVVRLQADSDEQEINQNWNTVLNRETRDRLGISTNKFSDSITFDFQVTSTLINKINYNFIAKRVHVKEGNLFRLADAQRSQRRLQELTMFRYVALDYVTIDTSGLLDIFIDLQFAPHYQLKIGAEAFTTDILTSNNLPVIGTNVSLRNRNTFGKSEFLELGLGGNVGLYASTLENNQFEQFFYEFSSVANISFPSFLLPFPSKRDLSLLSPTTSFTSTIIGEFREEFDRLSAGAALSYNWNHKESGASKILASQFTPLGFDFIFTRNITAAFEEEIADLPITIQRDYQSRFSSRLAYSFIRSNYGLTRLHPTWYFRIRTEIGGNFPWLLEKISPNDTSANDNNLQLFSSNADTLVYGQYVKSSAEIKYYHPVNSKTEWIIRAFFGFSHPYNNTGIVPRESRFFSGGTNSMRGWQSNTLGPGRLSLSQLLGEESNNVTTSSLIAPGGEISFEMNAELRFDIYSFLELAFFSDVGNVWFNNIPASEFEGAEKATFRRENIRLGWDAGLGFRFDFSFLILRLDVAQQLNAPDVGWVFGSGSRERRTQLNLGIGYPF